MSKKEIYAWTSFASMGALLGYYLIVVTGWTENTPEFESGLTSLFFRVFIIALVIETTLDLLRSFNKKEVFEDERDKAIEGKGFKNAYYFLLIAVFLVAGHTFAYDLLGLADKAGLFSAPFISTHILLCSAFVAVMLKSATQLYYYNRS